jgi:hypothetical protein
MNQPSQNINKKQASLIDSGQILKDVHLPDANALKVVNSNCLVPEEFTKVTIDYVTSGNGIGEISKAYYWSPGLLQESMVVVRGDQQPVSEITMVLFHNQITSTFISEKAFKMYDAAGSVGVYYALDGDTTPPNYGLDRYIKVDILTADGKETIASKTQIAIMADSEFVASYSLGKVLITSVTTGKKINAEDINSTLIISVTTEGVDDLSLNNKYFWVYTPTEKFHVWYNIGGIGVDPNPATTNGGIEIKANENDSRDTILVNTVNDINTGSTEFFSFLRDKQLTIRANKPGLTTEIEDGDSGFIFFTRLFGEAQRIIRTVELTYDASSNITEAFSY